MWLPFFYICIMTLITKSDFKGNVKISQNTKETTDLDLYIARNQKQLLLDLIGDYQYNLYIQPNAATSTKYFVLTNGENSFGNQFYYYDSEDCYISYFGILEALKYFTYWDYVRNLNAKATSVGIRFADAENSRDSTQLEVNSVIEQRYNLGVDNYKEATDFLKEMHDIKLHTNGITENAGVYTIEVIQKPNKNSLNLCSLINEGDEFELEENDYVVDSITFSTSPDTCSITFNAPTGLTFTKDHIYIDPFLDYKTKTKNYSVLDGFL